ncbi:hypothetical protein WPS_29330 [Vulcanimicrobium alpinum]|uniref:Uncharacterized protein n=1 Tax=Vulcanimicrobium alpinum TaxID=3016050 RepID=A0AAN1Y0C9_UNVUL|nr:hypothetical protein [Vulcanimicrobium alpinum]BDE07657.1 hypothetical protein WPS_29330 [Vulcanimicrobium alpinum]
MTADVQLDERATAEQPGLSGAATAACLLVACLFPITIAAMLVRWAVNAPQWDEWEVASLVIRMHQHTLSFADLWAQHNEHRMFVPYSLMLLLAQWRGWNVVREELIGIAFVVCAQALFFDLLRRSASRVALGISFLFGSAILYSASQAGNWMWGFQLAWFMIVFFVFAMVWLLIVGREAPLAFRLAIGVGFLASYTMSSGLLLWPAGLCLILLDRRVDGPKQTIAWIAAAGVATVLYLHGWSRGGLQSDPTYVLTHPFEVLGYLFAYFGAPLAWSSAPEIALPMCIGAVGVAAFGAYAISYARRKQHGRGDLEAPWLALGIFALLAGTMTDIGRAAFGIDQALASRYTTYSGLLWIALVGLTVCALRRAPLSIKLRSAVLVSAAASAVLSLRSDVNGVAEMRRIQAHDIRSLVTLRHFWTASDADLRMLYPNPVTVRGYAAQLVLVHDGPFRP